MSVQEIIDVLNKVEDKTSTWIPSVVVTGMDSNCRNNYEYYFRMDAKVTENGELQIKIY